MKLLKPYLRWLILVAILFFLGNAIVGHWQAVLSIRIDGAGWGVVAIAFLITLLAHAFAGWVWSWILAELSQPTRGRWGARVYLKTNIAKYLPGNIWHLYGRIAAAHQASIPLEVAALSVLMEVPLMAVAAGLIGLLGLQQWSDLSGWALLGIQGLCLVGMLLSVHPWCLNPILRYLGKLKQKVLRQTSDTFPTIHHYPWQPLLGEVGFLVLRGVGFGLTFWAIRPLPWQQMPMVLSAYSLGWLLGFIIPGLPGGVGALEALVIALLSSHIPPSDLIVALALHRVINTVAEAIGAGWAMLDERFEVK